MSKARDTFDARFQELIEKTADYDDLDSEEFTAAVRNLETFSKCRPPEAPSESEPEPIEGRAKILKTLSKVWDNETTRVLIKAGGTFAGVALVTYSTIRKDHVIERQALAQANQRNI